MANVSSPRGAIECKVVLLGKENVGKTCIMERFVYERYLADQTESQSVSPFEKKLEISFQLC